MPNYEKLIECFKNWDNIDKETNPIKSKNRDDTFIGKANCKSLQEIIKLRAERGFWDTEEMNAWPIENCIIIEMKKMGINKDTVKIENINGRTQISFDWAYPEEEIRRRTVVYTAQNTDDVVNDPNHCGISNIDGYYEKSMNNPRFNFLDTSSSDLPYISQLINPGGFALIGRSQFSLFNMGHEDKRLERVTRDQFGPTFDAIDIGS